jgi:hypothetical protein
LLKFIRNKNEILAIIVSSTYHNDGISFLTEGSENLEFGYMSHPKGYEVKPHYHPPIQRLVVGTQEVIYIKYGLVRVDFYSLDLVYLTSESLATGDWIILISGGHGLRMLEDSTIIEVKNGPYAGSEDKVRFSGGVL